MKNLRLHSEQLPQPEIFSGGHSYVDLVTI